MSFCSLSAPPAWLQTAAFDPMLRAQPEEAHGSQAQGQAGQARGASRRAPRALKRFFRDMLLIRRFEEQAGQMYGMGLIGGFCHLYIGEEAVVVGMQAALEEGDTIVTSYRDHGHMLACGMDPKGVMAELTGRRGGYSHGKGGSMHMFSREKNFFGGHGIVGAPGADRHRPRLCPSLSRRRADLGDLSRRRRDQPGPGLRELQHGLAVEAAGRLRHREQPLRHGHLGRAAPRPAPICSTAASPSASPASRSTAWMSSRCTRPAVEAVEHARSRQGADHPRNADLPLSRPLDVRPGEVPHARRGQPDAQRARSDRPSAAAPARRARHRRRGRAEARSRSRCGTSSPRRRNSPRTARSPIPSELWTDVLRRAAGSQPTKR